MTARQLEAPRVFGAATRLRSLQAHRRQEHASSRKAREIPRLAAATSSPTDRICPSSAAASD